LRHTTRPISRFALLDILTTSLYNAARYVGLWWRKQAFHINLNTATREEIVLIPRAGERMARQFAEFRRCGNLAQHNQ
jgi:hypothetical protein